MKGNRYLFLIEPTDEDKTPPYDVANAFVIAQSPSNPRRP